MVVSIPVIFAVGVIAFFLGLPPELLTITNFIAYASSLSTVIMVLVYLFTNSQQLRIMETQLKEMEMSRNSQIQPLPYLEKPKAEMQVSRYYIGPSTKFKRMRLCCRFFFEFSVNNIGNGPAVAVDFIPKLYPELPSNDYHYYDSLVDSLGRRIECISLREGDSKKSVISFFGLCTCRCRSNFETTSHSLLCDSV